MPSDRSTRFLRRLVPGLTLCFLLSGILSAHAVRGPRSGAEIFRQRCASCHGAKGEGTKRYRKPLTGSRSVGQLSAFIAKSMPPGAARKCAGEDAKKVAAYIYNAFYSPIAQARNRPARIQLARLTKRQYLNAVADLVGSFRPESARPWGDKRGLQGEYFNSARLRRGEPVVKRVDPELR